MTDDKPWWDSPYIDWQGLDERRKRYLISINEAHFRRLIAQGERREAKEREKEAHKLEIERRKIERQKAREAIKKQKAEKHRAEVLQRKAERDALRAKAREEKKKQKEQEKEERKRRRAGEQDEIEAELAAAHEAMSDPFDFGPDIDERDKKRARRYEEEMGEEDKEIPVDELGENVDDDEEEEEETVLSLVDETITDASIAPLHAYVYAENRGHEQQKDSRKYMMEHDFNKFMSSYSEGKTPLKTNDILMDVDGDEDDLEERRNWEALAKNTYTSQKPLAKVVFMFFRIRDSRVANLNKKQLKLLTDEIKKDLLTYKPRNMKKGEEQKWIRGLNHIKIFTTLSGQSYILDPVHLTHDGDQMIWTGAINYYDLQYDPSRYHDDRVIANFGMPLGDESNYIIAIPAKYVVFFQEYINKMPPSTYTNLFGYKKPAFDDETKLDKTPFFFIFTPIYTNAILEFDPRRHPKDQQIKIFTFAYVRKYERDDGQYTHWVELLPRTPGFYMAHGRINGRKKKC